MKTEISRDSHQPKKRYSGVYQQQGRMLTDADWNELVEILKERLNDALKDVVGNKAGSMGGTPRHRALKINDDLTIQPGHIYVDGIAAQIPGDTPIAYVDQPDFPEAPDFPPIPDSHVLPPKAYIIYADVWERTVTHLMDERLRDKGLHGADTCTRKQTMAQVKWCPYDSVDPANPDNIDPEQSGKNPSKGNAELTLTLLKKTTQPDPCDPCAAQLDVESKTGNYLFRVEVHDVQGDTNDQITLKWSSENGAEQYALKDAEEKVVEPPDEFKSEQWVYEFFDETSERHLGMHLAPDFTPSRGELTDGYPDPSDEVLKRSFVRRWDGYCILDLGSKTPFTRGMDRGITLSTDKDSTAPGYVKIDSSSLHINLSSINLDMVLDVKKFVAGDYWLADVREVEHKVDSVIIKNKAPQGIEHHYLTLGKVVNGVLQLNPEADRKYAFPPLTEMTRMFIAGGDGQEVIPGQPLPQPLRVGVANGEWPVEGASVAFVIEGNEGQIEADSTRSTQFNSGLAVRTDEFGIAECNWTPGIDMNADFRVKATLVDPDNPTQELDHPPVYFYANLVSADQVAYDPECMPNTNEATVHHLLLGPESTKLGDDNYYTVKEVLDALLCYLEANHIPYNDPDCDHDSVTVKSLLTKKEAGPDLDSLGPDLDNLRLDFDNNGHITVSDILDTLLCKLRAKHIPYDVTKTNRIRWRDVNAEEERPVTLPETVQEAIDDLLNNLHSEDIKYKPPCTGDTPPTVRSWLSIPDNTPSRVHTVLDKLLCDFNGTHLPIDKNDGDLCGRLKAEGIESVQDALGTLCRDIQWDNKHLHGRGVVCGLKVKCHDDRTMVEVEPGSALDCDGHRLRLDESLIVDLVENAVNQDLLDGDGNGSVCLWIDHGQDHGIQTNIEAHAPGDFWDTVLEGTLLKDFFDDCILHLMTSVLEQFPTSFEDDPPVTDDQRRLTELINLFCQLINPSSGQYVFLSTEEHGLIREFYNDLKGLIASETFCAMYDNDRLFPDYTLDDSGLDTIFGPPLLETIFGDQKKFSTRLRLHPFEKLAYTYGSGNKIYVYDLTTRELGQSLTFPVGENGENIDVQDVAFASNGLEMYVVALLDEENSIFATATISEDGSHTWGTTTTISGIKIVSLAVSSEFPNNLYAIGKSQGLFILEPTNILLNPDTPDVRFNATGLLELSADGTHAFAALNESDETEDSTMTPMTHVRNIDLNNVGGSSVFYRINGNDEENDIALHGNIVYLTGHDDNPEERILVGYNITTGNPAFPPVDLEGATVTRLAVLGDTSGGEYLLVALADKYKVMRFDLNSKNLDPNFRIPTQFYPFDIKVASDGKAYVLNTISNTLTVIDIETVFDPAAPPNYTLEPPTVIGTYRQGVMDAFSDLLSHLLQYLKDCFCDKFLIDCPDCTGDEKIYLGSVEIRGGEVYNICNFTKRHYAKTFPTWSYWLSTVPILPLLKRGFGLFCCTSIRDVAMLIKAYFNNLSEEGG
ncbi:MAG: hypothetical protein GY774_03915 [Planctomycetes bacterium]|nr:hypothetical protein [Planctomycetota bacterium]